MYIFVHEYLYIGLTYTKGMQEIKVWEDGHVKIVQLEHMGVWSSEEEAREWARIEGYSHTVFRKLEGANFELLVARWVKMQEKYNGNIGCEAGRVDGMVSNCRGLADWNVNEQYFCNKHKKYFETLDMLGVL